MQDNANYRLRDGQTGREVGDMSDEERESLCAVKDWCNSKDSDAIVSHSAADRFCEELSRLRHFDEETVIAFRGRVSPDTQEPHEFGPPPRAVPNRYNRNGEKTLYLATSEEGVRREVPEVDWCHKFEIPTKKMRIADIRQANCSVFINQVFFSAERGENTCIIDRNNYYFSHAVGMLVCNKFDGMLVPGVRGDREVQYDNLVLFVTEGWENWLVGNPKQL